MAQESSTLADKSSSRYFEAYQAQSHQRVQHVGRPKGRRNTQGVKVREAIERVFSGLGGWDAMLAWAKDNPSLFYASVVPKLLPHELAESGAGQSIRVVVYAPNQPTDKPLDITIPASAQIEQAEANDSDGKV